VSLKRRLRTLACCGLLEVGALFGMPMRPEQIQEFMQMLDEAKGAHVLPPEDHAGDPPAEPETAATEKSIPNP
jgi:hypothetical protein